MKLVAHDVRMREIALWIGHSFYQDIVACFYRNKSLVTEVNFSTSNCVLQRFLVLCLIV
jgi:hypothetical protein